VKRTRTISMMERAQAETEDVFGYIPTKEDVWKGIRHKDIKRNTRLFLYRAIHDTFMVGDKWERNNMLDEQKERAQCHGRDCGGTETMEHILCVCEAPGRKLVWKLANIAWKRSLDKDDLRPGIGMIIACGLAKLTDKQGKRQNGYERQYRILVSEAARLIWKIRCKRAIDQTSQHPTEEQIKSSWNATINERIKLDCELTNIWKYGKRAIPAKLVRAMWAGMLENEEGLPRNWMRKGGVLVGSGSMLQADVFIGSQESKEEDDEEESKDENRSDEEEPEEPIEGKEYGEGDDVDGESPEEHKA
jgi:hypothetical protein